MHPDMTDKARGYTAPREKEYILIDSRMDDIECTGTLDVIQKFITEQYNCTEYPHLLIREVGPAQKVQIEMKLIPTEPVTRGQ